MPPFLALAALALILALHAGPAAAATLDLTPLVDPLMGGIGIVLSAIISRVLWKAMKWLDLDGEEKLRGAINLAVDSGISLARLQVGQMIKAGAKVDVQSEIVARAGSYLVARVPESLAKFGLDGDGLAEFVTARVAKDIASAPIYSVNIGADGSSTAELVTVPR